MRDTDTDYTKIEASRLREMVDELYKIRERLTDWEHKFVSNLKKEQGQFTTLRKQNLIRVYNKYFSGQAFGRRTTENTETRR